MPAPFVKDDFFSHCIIYNFVKTQVFIGVWINIQVLSSIPLVNLSVFIIISGSFHYCSYIIELDIRDGNASGHSFILQNCLGNAGFLFL